MSDRKNKFVIGVDGGGTKTAAILADLNGKVIAQGYTAGSNIDKLGFEKSMDNILKAIKIVLGGNLDLKAQEVGFVYIALAGGTQRNKKRRQEIEQYISKKLNFFSILVESDDVTAFYSGTDKKEGVVLIAGTGSIAVGWKDSKKVIVGGWGHLWSDKGSAFWIGKKVLQKVSHSIDFNIPSLLKDEVFAKLKIKENGDLMNRIYQPDAIHLIASLSSVADLIAVDKKDKDALKILEQAGDELALQATQVIKKLNFQTVFPLVLVGSVFNSKIVLERTKREIKKRTFANFIIPNQKPVMGAVKLAIKNYKSSTL